MAENGSIFTGVFPGEPGATGRAASFTQKMAVLWEFGSLHRELAARSPGFRILSTGYPQKWLN